MALVVLDMANHLEQGMEGATDLTPLGPLIASYILGNWEMTCDWVAKHSTTGAPDPLTECEGKFQQVVITTPASTDTWNSDVSLKKISTAVETGMTAAKYITTVVAAGPGVFNIPPGLDLSAEDPVYLGQLATAPLTASKLNLYYDTTTRKSYIYFDDKWQEYNAVGPAIAFVEISSKIIAWILEFIPAAIAGSHNSFVGTATPKSVA